MKKLLSIVLSLILAVACIPVTAMADTTFVDEEETNILMTAEVPELSSITVTAPTKTTYNIGEELDTTGMVVTANYSDYSTKEVTSDVNLSGFDSSTAGEVTVTVSYTEKENTVSETFNVTVTGQSVNTYTIAVSANPAAYGTVSGGGEFAEDASVTVTATANSGYYFVKWTENGEQVSTDASYTFTATSDRTLVAEFEEVIYTVQIEPGESGDIIGISVRSTTILTEADMWAGNYTQTAGCFYRGNNGKLYYKFPSRCSFTAPEDKEFDCWQASFGGTFDHGTSIDIAEKGSFYITALWKEIVPEPDPCVTLSIPATLNINYGDTETAFDVQVKEAVFSTRDSFEVRFNQSSFQCTTHNGTIPFTVSTNADGTSHGYHGNLCYVAIFREMSLPFSFQGFIHITGDNWAAAKPGSYTAVLKASIRFN
ncbi:MAG: bacterial Ig-like domain-containing protein [Clostridia bacterium]|nr:bacterial Ig-like domain-containing protein [Clostridia bacterium]